MHQDPMSRHEHSSPVSRLVVAARAGDEVAGCGGLLAKHHDDTVVVIVVEPDARRQVQLRTAHRMLGTSLPTILGLPDAPLVDHAERIAAALSALVARLRPTELYLPYPSLHRDHLVAYEAGMRSTGAVPPADAPLATSVLAYDAEGAADDHLAEVHWGMDEALLEEDVDRAVAAAVAYRSPVAHDLKRRAGRIGAARGLRWAEQFALVRTAPLGAHESASVPALTGAAR